MGRSLCSTLFLDLLMEKPRLRGTSHEILTIFSDPSPQKGKVSHNGFADVIGRRTGFRSNVGHAMERLHIFFENEVIPLQNL